MTESASEIATDVEVVEAERPPIRYGPHQRPAIHSSFHWAMLTVCTLVITASLVLDVNGTAVTAPIAGIPLPGVCSFRRLTGIDCPGCGLTRCFVSLSHGRIAQAWSFNPAGLFLYVAMLFQIPYRIIQIRRIQKGAPGYDLGWSGSAFLLCTAILLILQWAIRMSSLG